MTSSSRPISTSTLTSACAWPHPDRVIGFEILGEVYEQFLGKVIRLTAGHQAKVEEKPEVRKAGELRPARLTSARCRSRLQSMSAQGRPALTGAEFSKMSPEFTDSHGNRDLTQEGGR